MILTRIWIPLIWISMTLTKNNKKGVSLMPETNETYQPLTFDALIKIGLASPGRDSGAVLRRGKKA